MAGKQIVYAEEARAKILAGVNKLAQAVKVTLGPPAASSSSKNPSARPPSPRTA
jgi:chaperonin GroEL (HSP60 family)